MKKTTGSNQYQSKFMFGTSKKFVLAVFLLMAGLSAGLEFFYQEPETIVLYALEPTTTPDISNQADGEEGAELGSPAPSEVVGDNDVAKYIYDEFKQYGDDVALEALVISYGESEWNLDALNDQYNEPEGSRDRGLWQINDHWHPNVTDKCAFDMKCSTEYAKHLYETWDGWGAWVARYRLEHLQWAI